MIQPLLSIGMIVKNEIRCLEKCLKALQPLRDAIPCQLVIADTGSVDGTREVAERYADILFDFTWVNDFSAARNAVMDRCTGRWYLTVDADEYLDPDFSQLVDFLTGPEADQYLMAMVNQYNYMDIGMKGTGADFLAGRMARLDVHPRYMGAIHECFPPVAKGQTKILMDVKLHHDGYAVDPKHPELHTRKSMRNLDLLDEELKSDPQDLRRLLQCLESAGPFPARKEEYARRAMKALVKRRKTPEGNAYGPIICYQALGIATAQKMPELEQWRQWAVENYTDSMFLDLDGDFILMKHHMDEREYQEVPELASKFLKAWQDYQDRNFDLTILMRSILHCTARKFEVYARASAGEALSRLGRTAEAAALLCGEPDWEGMSSAELYTFLGGCAWAAGEPSLQTFVATGAAVVRDLDGKDGAAQWDRFVAAAEAAFQPHDPDDDAPERPWRLYARVEGSLGQAAALMDAADAASAEELLLKISDWTEVPAPAVARAVELGVELPADFYTQSRERLQTLAVQLSGILPPGDTLDWTDKCDFTAAMTSFQFLFDLLTALLQSDKTWEEEGDWRGRLCNQFMDAAADYLPNYYNMELLNDEAEWTALPGMHRFALYLLHGREAQLEGDMAGYMRFLRQGLKQAPKMKRMVQFLLDETGVAGSADSASPEARMELAALADQVRSILNRYAPDDPAVQALKQSEVYQKVANLLESKPADPGINFI